MGQFSTANLALLDWRINCCRQTQRHKFRDDSHFILQCSAMGPPSRRQTLPGESAHFCRATRNGGNGQPSARARVRTLRIVRLRAAAALTTEAPWATRAFKRSSSASVHTQGLVGPVIVCSLLARNTLSAPTISINDSSARSRRSIAGAGQRWLFELLIFSPSARARQVGCHAIRTLMAFGLLYGAAD